MQREVVSLDSSAASVPGFRWAKLKLRPFIVTACSQPWPGGICLGSKIQISTIILEALPHSLNSG